MSTAESPSIWGDDVGDKSATGCGFGSRAAGFSHPCSRVDFLTLAYGIAGLHCV